MTEILTESFCERCGTRYTFETVAPRQKRLGGLKTLGRGLRTFVMSDDTTLDEAMASARSDEEREMTGRQLDAFHKTFNFCMNCRQYTCSNCWNPIEARCLSCAPRADQVVGEPAQRLATQAPFEAAPPVDQLLLAPHDHEVLEAAEPEIPVMDASDLLGRLEMAPATEGEAAAAMEAAEAEPVAAAEAVAPTNGVEPDLVDLLAATAPVAKPPVAEPPVAEPPVAEPEAADADDGAAAALFEAAAEAQAAEAARAVAEIEPSEEIGEAPPTAPPWLQSTEERARSASERTGGLLRRFRPGQSLDDEIAAYEASLTAPAEAAPAEPEAQPQPVAAFEAEPEPEPVAALEPEPVEVEAAAPEPEPEPIAAVAEAPEPAPVAAEPEGPAPRRDIVEQPAWPTPEIPAAAEPEGAPEWPTGPRWPTAIPARPAPPPVRPAVPPPAANVPPPFTTPVATNEPAARDDALAFLTARRAGEAMWAASAQDVVAATGRPGETAQLGVRSCVSCGLSLSATARFCRRCGTRQDEV